MPDTSYLRENQQRIRVMIVTHGHEDHIGAIYHIIEKVPQIRVWASPFTSELIKKKLKSDKKSIKINLLIQKFINWLKNQLGRK